MRVYRTDREGIEVLRISGTLEMSDAEILVNHVGTAADASGGCCILDFARVQHADYRVFEILEKLAGKNPGVIFSGFNDYLLSIFAFVGSMEMTTVFSDWRKAFRFLKAEKGKLVVYAGGRAAAGEGPAEVGDR